MNKDKIIVDFMQIEAFKSLIAKYNSRCGKWGLEKIEWERAE